MLFSRVSFLVSSSVAGVALMSASALANGWLEEMPLSFGSGISALLASEHSDLRQDNQVWARPWNWSQRQIQSLRATLSPGSSETEKDDHSAEHRTSGHRPSEQGQLLSQALSLHSGTTSNQASSNQETRSFTAPAFSDPRPSPSAKRSSDKHSRQAPGPSPVSVPEQAWSPRSPLLPNQGLNLSQLLFPDLSQSPADRPSPPDQHDQTEQTDQAGSPSGALSEEQSAAKALRPSSQKRATVIPDRAALNYFSEVAFTGEFSETVPMIRKWEDDIRIRVHGNPSQADITTLNQVVEELNGLLNGVTIALINTEALSHRQDLATPPPSPPQTNASKVPNPLASNSPPSSRRNASRIKLEQAKSTLEKSDLGTSLQPSTSLKPNPDKDGSPAPNFDIFFVPESQFSRYEPSYLPTNYGFFWAWSDEQGYLRKAKVLISSNSISQRERSHLIREELTQALGLMQDSFSHKDSIFYQDWTATTQFSGLDQQLIQMLYRSDILPGMSQRQALKVLQSP